MSESKRITAAAAQSAVDHAQKGKRSRTLAEWQVDDAVEIYRKARRWAARHGLQASGMMTDGGAVCNSYSYPGKTTQLVIDAKAGITARRVNATSRRFGDAPSVRVYFLVPEDDDRRGPDFPKFRGHAGRREGNTLVFRW